MFRLFAVAPMEISLRDRSRSMSFLLAAGSLGLLIAAETLLVASVRSFETPACGRLLLALDQADPRLQARLGQVYRGIDAAEGVRHLRRATELSPYDRFYWSDLAAACESTGDTQCSDRAIERLVKLSPRVPRYRWQASQSYLRRNRLGESLEQFRCLSQLDPKYAAAIWASLRTVQGPDLIFQELLADSEDSSIKVAYVDFLSEQGDHDAAYRVWKLVAAEPRQFPFNAAKPYLDRLIALDRIEEARQVWQDVERLGIIEKHETDESGNLIFNGDFEQSPLNAGFDWRWSDRPYLALDFAAPDAYHGAHCLRIDFTVNRNDEYEPAFEIVPVLPNRTYKLEAYVRSEDITSDTGPSLRVRDTREQSSSPDAVSETTVRTTPWHPISLSFLTGPQTHSMRLSIWRPRERTFPTEISGTFWLDMISIHAADSALQQDTPDGQR
jgi:hypothetical protein